MEAQRRKLESIDRREGPTAGLTVRTARGEGRGPTPRMGSEAGGSSSSGGISPKGVGIVGASMIRDRSRSRLAGDHSPPLAPGSASPPPPDSRCRAESGAHAPSPPLAGFHAPPAQPPQLVVEAGPPGRSSPFDEDCGSEDTVDVLWTTDADTVRLPAIAALPPPALAPLAIGGGSRGVSAGSNVTVNAWGAGGVDSRASTPGSTFRTYSMSSLADGGSVGPTPMTPAFASPQPWARVNSTDTMSLANGGGAFGSGLFSSAHGFGTGSAGAPPPLAMGGGGSAGGYYGGGGSGADSPAAVATRPHGRIRRGRWRKGKPIGMGTCGKVYLGLNDDTGELMAVKEVTLESKEKQLRELYTEIQVMHRLRHPHIVAYLGAELVDSQRTLCIFQEWVPAGSLHQLLEHFGALGERMTATYTRQVLLGLAYLHLNGVIHRDVKATNVLVDDRGRVKLADFGCALLLDDGDGGSGRNGTCSRDSLTMSIKGTPLFMAPEILLRQRSGRRVDIWSLGCVVMEMATTRPPWDDMFSHPVQLIAHFHEHKGPPPMPEGVSERLRAFLLRCFTWDPKERPRARDLLEDPFLLLGSSVNIASSASTSGIATPPMSGGGGGGKSASGRAVGEADGGAGSEEEVPLEHMNAQDAMQRLRKASSFDLLNSAAHRGGGHYGMAGGGTGGSVGGALGLRHAKSALANAPVDEDEVAAETRRRRRSATAVNRDAAVAQLSVYATLTVAPPAVAGAAAAGGGSSGGSAPPALAAGSGGGGGVGDAALHTNALVAAALAANSAATIAVQKPASNRAAAWRLRRHSTGTCAAAAENGPPLAAAATSAPAAAAAVAPAAAAAAAPLAAAEDTAEAPRAPFDTINLDPVAATDAAAMVAAAPVLAAAAADAVDVPPPQRPLAGPAAAVAAALEMRAAVSAAAASQYASQPLEILAPPPPEAKGSPEFPAGSAPAAAGGGWKQTPLTTPQMPWSPGAVDERLATVTPERAGNGTSGGKDRRHRAMTLAWGLRNPGGP